MSSSTSPVVAGEGFWADLFNSVFSPEYNTVPQRLMNYAFYALFVVLAILVFLTSYNPHVIALLTLALGLWMSINWFMKELAKMPASSKQVQQMPDAPQTEAKKDL
ncbi:uncharacterized protein PAN0_009d3842 [Moesziomyces antarcticus]|uniref:Uncharacterized protein n=2 Tax=Pseudozyma antarctica TaxID=84753 RepID=A0A081CG28_PSEA2|nr:uncharacterized protein PAN0_009d3842 [Moesziomyces antarcticus]GAK65624.1 conserved hypothetical protein [Moesziomyces antarcticus]SPO46640.1 related to PKR1 - V-ATPase Assembly Factor [Moesziomyces antarcticus]